MADEHCKEHDEKHTYAYEQHGPPHVSNPVNCCCDCGGDDICQAIKCTVRIDYHTPVEEVTVACKVAAGESDLVVPSH